MDNKEYKERMYKTAVIHEALMKAAEYAKEYEEKAEKYTYLAVMLREDCKRLKNELKELEEGAENAKS